MWLIKTQKAMADVVGFAFLWLSVTPVGKRVFLLVFAAIPNAMLCMTTTAVMAFCVDINQKKKQLIID